MRKDDQVHYLTQTQSSSNSKARPVEQLVTYHLQKVDREGTGSSNIRGWPVYSVREVDPIHYNLKGSKQLKLLWLAATGGGAANVDTGQESRISNRVHLDLHVLIKNRRTLKHRFRFLVLCHRLPSSV